MKTAILGATKGMGRALARALAERGDELCLLGRNLEDLQRSAEDLQVRGGAKQAPAVIECDLSAKQFGELFPKIEAALGGLDCVIVTAGQFGQQEELEADESRLAEVLDTNFSATILFCEAARKALLARGGGTLCVFSSVAGDRGRKPVGLYGATKAGLSHYLESLDHKYKGQGLTTICVKPGFVKTGMTAGLKPPPFAGEPEQVAKDVVRAIDHGIPLIYTPMAWGLVLGVIKRLPRFVMRRINF